MFNNESSHPSNIKDHLETMVFAREIPLGPCTGSGYQVPCWYQTAIQNTAWMLKGCKRKVCVLMYPCKVTPSYKSSMFCSCTDRFALLHIVWWQLRSISFRSLTPLASLVVFFRFLARWTSHITCNKSNVKQGISKPQRYSSFQEVGVLSHDRYSSRKM